MNEIHTNVESESDSDFYDDVMDESDEEDGYSSGRTRTWRTGHFTPHIFPFNSQFGINLEVFDNENESPLKFFEMLFDQAVLEQTVNETNKYHSLSDTSAPSSSTSHQAPWIETNISEIYSFLGIVMLMSHTKKNRIKDYWSTDQLISTPMFGTIFSRDRFLSILKFLHFNDNLQQQDSDRLHKIRPLLHHLKKKFKLCIKPNKNLCIDESIMQWNGRLNFKQFISSKRHRFGVKLFVLCDCYTGFNIDFIIYTGQQTEFHLNTELGMSGSLVMTLLNDYLDKGHVVFLDNWYTSPTSFEKLYKRRTGACGTVRRTRAGLPKFLAKLRKGEQTFEHTNVLLAVKWHDKRDVYILSTIHTPDMVVTEKIDRTTNKPIEKLLCIKDYNENMGIIDQSDMQISFSESIRKSIKWYKKLFFHMLDLSMLNVYILYKEKNQTSLELTDFRLEVIRQIFEKYGSQQHSRRGRPSAEKPLRLTARHFPEITGGAKRKCIVCSSTVKRPKKQSRTRYECSDCNVGLCIPHCFRDYHTLKSY